MREEHNPGDLLVLAAIITFYGVLICGLLFACAPRPVHSEDLVIQPDRTCRPDTVKLYRTGGQ